MNIGVGILVGLGLVVIVGATIVSKVITNKRGAKNAERSLEMQALLIHLPPSTDDVNVQGRDYRDIADEAISEAQVIYSIIASTAKKKSLHTKFYRQKNLSFEIVAKDGLVKYYALVPYNQVETVRQAVNSAYPTARLEETDEENIFSAEGGMNGVAGGELELKKDYFYPIATYQDTKRDAAFAMLSALSATKPGEGMAVQMVFRPCDRQWTKKAKEQAKSIRDGKEHSHNDLAYRFFTEIGHLFIDIIESVYKPPDERQREEEEKKNKELSNLDREKVETIENKTKFPGFETTLRLIVSTGSKERSQAILAGLVSSFSQFESPAYNGFRYQEAKNPENLAKNYILREFTERKSKVILNSIELASIFHLPNQKSIPTSQVERQMTKQVDGPAKLVTDGVLIGINEFRGVKKEIRLSEEDRRRHLYVIGSTGMGKSVFLRNIALQDMMDGRGFAFIDPHGDVTEEIMGMVPPERMDDVIYFDPGNIDNPIGMNMFEFTTADQKDFIVQEGINMLQSLYDPNNQGFFGARGQHMFRNAALLLMSDPAGATFIDIPQCFIDPEFVKSKLKYVTDHSVFDYWTKEFPASQQSNDAGEIITWFSSKWGPFLSNTMMKNILGQNTSGFNLREIMDQKKILLVNLSKGKLGETNSKLLGMIFVMKFQTAAMSRVDTPEDDREDFCLFVDEFQNFSTESFESILSEARKFRLNLIVANQFMTQLTDKIREGVLGNVGTIVSGRLGVTDAQLMEKVFSPTFTAEDLHKTPNRNAIATVMMNGVPSSPFTMTWPKIELDGGPEVLERMKEYSAIKYGRPRAEVEAEIDARYNSARTEKAQRPAPSPPSEPASQGEPAGEAHRAGAIAHAQPASSASLETSANHLAQPASASPAQLRPASDVPAQPPETSAGGHASVRSQSTPDHSAKTSVDNPVSTHSIPAQQRSPGVVANSPPVRPKVATPSPLSFAAQAASEAAGAAQILMKAKPKQPPVSSPEPSESPESHKRDTTPLETRTAGETPQRAHRRRKRASVKQKTGYISLR